MNAEHSPPALDSPAAQAAFVAAMRDPASYAALHPVSEPVRCIETHVSWVFLTGPFAYKVKKPLRLSFIDYSTPARRAALCREELRLNRRHAPGLYVDVVPITGTPWAPRVGGAGAGDDGPPFEHALRMVQFDPDDELTQILQTGHVTLDECARFGERIAQMHAAAEQADPVTPYGVPDTVHRTTLDNFAEIACLHTDREGTQQLRRLQTHVQQLFVACDARMAARRLHGRVREGHGDLHCGNVVRWQGALVAFDGLEFDPRLRWIDVANDIAFLTMDLSAHGRDDLRRATLQAWLTTSGDFDALPLLPYFECYRALVRAKVATLRARQAGDADTQRPPSATQAQHYLEWMERRITRPAPTVVVMAGLSGSGKTWLGRRIAAELGALVVRSDIERKRLAGLQPLQSSASAPDAGLYSIDFNARTYAHLRECVASCVQGGESVVVDAANLRRDEREQFLAIAPQHASNAVIVHCTAPIAVLRARVAERSAAAADASEATVELLERQPSYWEPFGERENRCVLTVDTTVDESIDHALRMLTTRSQRGSIC